MWTWFHLTISSYYDIQIYWRIFYGNWKSPISIVFNLLSSSVFMLFFSHYLRIFTLIRGICIRFRWHTKCCGAIDEHHFVIKIQVKSRTIEDNTIEITFLFNTKLKIAMETKNKIIGTKWTYLVDSWCSFGCSWWRFDNCFILFAIHCWP